MATRRTADKSSPTPALKKVVAKSASESAKKSASKKPAATKAMPAKTVPAKGAPAKKLVKGAAGSDATSPADKVSRLPDFRLTDQQGKVVTRKDLLGAPLVLYFYPKDDTPGCTTEACSFRDETAAFRKLGIRVVGVSPDSERSHARFAEKYSLEFTLLSDPEKVLSQAFGVWQLKKNYGKEYMGIVRSTFLIDAAGRVVNAWRGVKVPGHTAAVLEAGRSLGKG